MISHINHMYHDLFHTCLNIHFVRVNKNPIHKQNSSHKIYSRNITHLPRFIAVTPNTTGINP